MREPLVVRLRSRLTTWFPVVLLATLAMLTYWLDAQVQRGNGSGAEGATDPDYYLEDFAATRYGKDGSIVQQLAAKRLVHFGNDRPTEVTLPQLITTTPGKPALRVRADRGTVSADNENVWLAGNVVGERDASPGHSKLTIVTEYLHVVPRLEKADTDRRVTMTDANGTHTGNAMEADNKARTIHLRNGVTGQLKAHPNE